MNKKDKVKKKKDKAKTKKHNIRHKWKLGIEELATKHFDVSSNAELIVREGNYQYNIHDLVKRFGTPLEVVFPFVIEERLNELINTFKYYIRLNKYRGKFYFHYPMKVNQNKEFVLPIISEGAHIEVGSVNELWIVKRMWEQEQFSRQIKVICNGPKTNKYLGLIYELKQKGLDIVPIIEDRYELDSLKEYRGELGIRVDPEIKVQSHWDKRIDRFGFPGRELLDLGRIRNLKILHYHIGSQIIKLEDMISPLKKVMDVYIKLKAMNPTLDTINLGGGFAVPYIKRKMYSADSIVKRLLRTLKEIADRRGIPHPNIIVEWGRYLVAPAQITIYRIISQKPIPKSTASWWYIIDGSFINDLPDTWAIHQKWHVVPVNYLNAERLSRVWLAGSSCDSDDKYTGNSNYVSLPRLEDLEQNDKSLYITFFDTGAYQDSLASHHCLLSSPAKIIAQNGVITVARKRETAEEVGKQFGW
ncbi:MAG: hypothetical protein QY317_06895 [Candidatus Jettenia caeni]|nr:MAG: hypothetical protein QY317_06895 [Candidatus Jettenia caeni]